MTVPWSICSLLLAHLLLCVGHLSRRPRSPLSSGATKPKTQFFNSKSFYYETLIIIINFYSLLLNKLLISMIARDIQELKSTSTGRQIVAAYREK